jgi:hypothetical protein
MGNGAHWLKNHPEKRSVVARGVCAFSADAPEEAGRGRDRKRPRLCPFGRWTDGRPSGKVALGVESKVRGPGPVLESINGQLAA